MYLIINDHIHKPVGAWLKVAHTSMAIPFSLVLLVPYIEGAYGRNSPWCWIHEYKGDINGEGLLAFRIAFRLPVIIGTITCVSLMTYIMCKYVRRARLLNDQWQLIAVRKVALILIYPIKFALASVGSILHPIVQRVLSVSDDTSTIYDVEMVFLTMFFIYDMYHSPSCEGGGLLQIHAPTKSLGTCGSMYTPITGQSM